MKTDPDVYFKPQVKKDLYQSIVDHYLRKNVNDIPDRMRNLPKSNGLRKSIKEKNTVLPNLKKKKKTDSAPLNFVC